MAEQSHKREMSDAIRGDFERLRARRERGRYRPEPRPASPERVVLTRPRTAAEAAPPAEPEPEAGNVPADEVPSGGQAAAPPRRSWRDAFRRGRSSPRD